MSLCKGMCVWSEDEKETCWQEKDSTFHFNKAFFFKNMYISFLYIIVKHVSHNHLTPVSTSLSHGCSSYNT